MADTEMEAAIVEADLQRKFALEFFAKYGGVHSDPEKLQKVPPTPAELAAAVNRAVSNGQSRGVAILMARIVEGRGIPDHALFHQYALMYDAVRKLLVQAGVIREDAEPSGPEILLGTEEYLKVAQDEVRELDELRVLAAYAEGVLQGHLESNVHSLGCDVVLFWLRKVLGKPVDRDLARYLPPKFQAMPGEPVPAYLTRDPDEKTGGLWRNSKDAPEGKYLVLRRDGTVPEWPYFVIGAVDPNAPAGLVGYANEAEKNGVDPQYVADVRAMALEFAEICRERGPGNPDAVRHRKDDPEIIAKMRTAKGA